MKSFIVFDCYQTLIYKKELEKIVQRFCLQDLKKRIPLNFIESAFQTIYDRYKLKDPAFNTQQERKKFYIIYNKELFKILGISISNKEAILLNHQLKKSEWGCYSDTLSALKLLKSQEFSLGLISNWTKSLKSVIDSLELSCYFDFVYSSAQIEIEKPNPKIFTKILYSAMNQFDNIYYVGNDYELDIVPSKEAGLIPILIDRDNRYPYSDCIRIKKLTEIINIVL